MFEGFYKVLGLKFVNGLKEKADTINTHLITLNAFEEVVKQFGSKLTSERRRLLSKTNGGSLIDITYLLRYINPL
jgi:hypothetical protein